ncbi:MAG: amidohydrolase family protein [Planctomycetes bacterium]|nr:amidohydrolase family protein [Planctomycetota bacterium]
MTSGGQDPREPRAPQGAGAEPLSKRAAIGAAGGLVLAAAAFGVLSMTAPPESSSENARGGPTLALLAAPAPSAPMPRAWWDAYAAEPAQAPTTASKSAAPSRKLAILALKAAVVGPEGRDVVDDAVVLVSDGKIEAIGPRASTAIPAGYEVLDRSDKWITPGFVDLHCHIAGKSFLVNDINDMVYLTNPELRASSVVEPDNPNLRRAIGGGVTSVLFIPGSGTNMGGQGVLLKTGLEHFEEMRIRDPGSLKLAQAGNPERWAINPGRSFMNWNTRNTFARGLTHAKLRKADPKLPRNIQWDVFGPLADKTTQVSTHTQIYQVVLMTLTMVRQGFGLDVYIDHGEWFGSKLAGIAQEIGAGAIIGPREIDRFTPGFSIDTDGQIQGIAAQYQKNGHKEIGFNTDSPVIPQEELHVQAATACRFGFDGTRMDALRGLTIVPAKTAGIAGRVGSLAPGKDADLLVCDGDPVDPRTTIEAVFIEGRSVYDMRTEERRW